MDVEITDTGPLSRASACALNLRHAVQHEDTDFYLVHINDSEDFTRPSVRIAHNCSEERAVPESSSDIHLSSSSDLPPSYEEVCGHLLHDQNSTENPSEQIEPRPETTNVRNFPNVYQSNLNIFILILVECIASLTLCINRFLVKVRVTGNEVVFWLFMFTCKALLFSYYGLFYLRRKKRVLAFCLFSVSFLNACFDVGVLVAYFYFQDSAYIRSNKGTRSE